MKKVKVRSWGDQETFSEKNGGGKKNAKCPTLQGGYQYHINTQNTVYPKKIF